MFLLFLEVVIYIFLPLHHTNINPAILPKRIVPRNNKIDVDWVVGAVVGKTTSLEETEYISELSGVGLFNRDSVQKLIV